MEPFAGARAPRPVPFLDAALPPPRTPYEAALQPLIQSLIAEGAEPLRQVVSRVLPNGHVVAASMSDVFAGNEIYPMEPMGKAPTNPIAQRAYIDSIEYDFRFTFELGFNATNTYPQAMYDQTAIEHPPDNKIGLRVALIEIDHGFDIGLNADGEITTLPLPTLNDLLVRPCRTMDGNEQPWTSGPTSVSAYYSPWRKSRDLSDVGAVSTETDPVTLTYGTYDTSGLVFAQGAADYGNNLFQRFDSRPSAYTFRVLWETWEERAPQLVPSRWPAFKIGGENAGGAPADGVGAYSQIFYTGSDNSGFINYQGEAPGYVPGGFGGYGTRGSLTEERYRMHMRGSIPLRRSYWWTGSPFLTPEAFGNTRRLYWVFIPKGSCCRTADSQNLGVRTDWSLYRYPTPKAQGVFVRQIGSIEDLVDTQLGSYVQLSDAYIGRNETQQAQLGARRYDIGQQRDRYQRGDR